MEAAHLSEKQFFGPRSLWIVALFSLCVLGLAIRLFDLTDLPLDFHPTRQLLSALKARGMYYRSLTDIPQWRRDFAIREWKVRAQVEPEALERLVAGTYRLTGEGLWVARIYSSLSWVVGGLFLFFLVRDLLSTDAALAAVAIHLFLPYAVVASRSFQPDPLMVMLTIAFWWAVLHWARTISTENTIASHHGASRTSPPRGGSAIGWVWAILAGIAGGLAIYIKFVAAFFVIGGGLGAVLGREPLRLTLRRPQLWAMLFLGILPGAAYVIYGVWIAGFLGQQFGGRFAPALFLEPSYYLGWLNMLNLVIGPALLMLALLGPFFFRSTAALRFALGTWIAYALFGLYFNYHISTHDYYTLPLIPIAAISVAPLAAFGLNRLSTLAGARQMRLLALAIMGLGALAMSLELRARLAAVDYRPEAAMWVEIGQRLGPDARLVALTQDYGMRLTYWGWLAPTPWPSTGDVSYHALRGARRDFDDQFQRLTQNRQYFLVTDFRELDRQPDLKEILYSSYPALFESDAYVIFDLAGMRAD